MDKLRQIKGKVFRDLHSAEGIFVMPGAWNAGNNRVLEEAGFPAVGRTGEGIAFCPDLSDHARVPTRKAALEQTRRISGAVPIPVTADAGNRDGHRSEEVDETIHRRAFLPRYLQPLPDRPVAEIDDSNGRGCQ